MNFWILLWKIVFIAGLVSFILMFIFIAYKGFFEIIELLKKSDQSE